MPSHGRVIWKRMLAGISAATLMVSAGAIDVQAQLPDTSAAAETVPLQPSLLDFLTGAPVSAKMQDLAKPKLLQKAFAKLPKTDPKGLAAIIKAKEVDVANRVAAAKYLGKVDCQQFPESQLALKDLLLDEFEPVRYEAALALQKQFGRGPDEFCFPWQGKSKRKDACRGCCNTENIQAVIDVMHDLAYGTDDYGCPKEPSARVKDVLADAISLCVHCDCQESAPTYAEPLEPQIEPGVSPDGTEAPTDLPAPALPTAPGENDAATNAGTPEAVPPADDAKPALPAAPSDDDASADASESIPTLLDDLFVPLPEIQSGESSTDIAPVSYESADAKPLDILEGNCPVELVDGGVGIPTSDSIVVTHKGTFDTYRFPLSSEEARARFLENPDKYFPVLDGYCVTTWSDTGMKVRGKYASIYRGRYYCFAIPSWQDQFNANPEKTLKTIAKRLQSFDSSSPEAQ
jgi:YHS domain-containing protein